MTILYRRFLLVTSLIAALGVLTAHMIQETRRPLTGLNTITPVQSQSCNTLELCNIKSSMVGQKAGMTV